MGRRLAGDYKSSRGTYERAPRTGHRLHCQGTVRRHHHERRGHQLPLSVPSLPHWLSMRRKIAGRGHAKLVGVVQLRVLLVPEDGPTRHPHVGPRHFLGRRVRDPLAGQGPLMVAVDRNRRRGVAIFQVFILKAPSSRHLSPEQCPKTARVRRWTAGVVDRRLARRFFRRGSFHSLDREFPHHRSSILHGCFPARRARLQHLRPADNKDSANNNNNSNNSNNSNSTTTTTKTSGTTKNNKTLYWCLYKGLHLPAHYY